MEPRTGAQRAFAVKVFYKNDDSFVFSQHEFWRKFRIHRNRAVHVVHELFEFCRGRSEDLCVKSLESWLQTARVTQSGDVQNGVDSFNGLSHYRNILGCTYCFYTPTFLF
jgi:hypothetical protein